MNLAGELRAFSKWIKANPLSPSAQLLWFRLMLYNNECDWSEWFVVDNRMLAGLIGVESEKTAMVTRDKLVECGLVEYKRGKKGSPNRYHIIPLYSKFYCVSDGESDTTNAGYSTVQMGDMYIKQNKRGDKTIPSGDGGVSARGAEHPEVMGLDSYAGMTETLAEQVRQTTGRLFRSYFGREPTPQDAALLFERIRRTEKLPDGTWRVDIDPDRLGVAEYAFETAGRKGACCWDYLDGVFARCAARGLTTRYDCEGYDADRDFDRMEAAK